MRKDALGQDQGGNGHRGRLRDEGAQQGHGRQHDEIETDASRQGDGEGQKAHTGPGGLQDRTGARNNHDGEDEHRLREIAGFNVMRRRLCAINGKHRHDQDQRPETEHHLDFPEQMPDPGMGWPGARQPLEKLGGKCVQDGHSK